MLRWLLPLVAALALAVALVALPRGHVRYANQASSSSDTTISFGATDSVPGTRRSKNCAGPNGSRCTAVLTPARLARNRSVQVHYPREMKSDESAVVELRYSVNIDSTGVADPDSLGSRKKNVSLSGPNFAVKPDESRPLAWRGRDTATIVWSVLPAHTGPHKLIVDASTLYNGQAVRVMVFDPAGQKLQDVQADNIVLPVDVVTIWGISERAAQAAKAILGVITFALGFFGFNELRGWLRRPAPSAAVTGTPQGR